MRHAGGVANVAAGVGSIDHRGQSRSPIRSGKSSRWRLCVTVGAESKSRAAPATPELHRDFENLARSFVQPGQHRPRRPSPGPARRGSLPAHAIHDPLRVERPGRGLTAPRRATGPRRPSPVPARRGVSSGTSHRPMAGRARGPRADGSHPGDERDGLCNGSRRGAVVVVCRPRSPSDLASSTHGCRQTGMPGADGDGRVCSLGGAKLNGILTH